MSLRIALQVALAAKIQACEYFAGPASVLVIYEDLGDIENQIQRAIGKIGLVILVQTPDSKAGDYPFIDTSEPRITVYENVVINRAKSGTQKTCPEVIHYLKAYLLGWEPVTTAGTWSPLRYVDVIPAQVDEQPITYQLILATQTIMMIT